MKITIASTAGFCMGVRRAVEMVLEAPSKYDPPIYTFGPLIHNPQVLSLLEEKGISILAEIPANGSGTVLIRAHGVPPEDKRRLTHAGFTVIDATCPRVIKVQSIISKHAKDGYASIIVGDREHPEVKGLLGFAGGKGIAVDRFPDLEKVPAFDRVVVVAQTTQNTGFFEHAASWIREHHPHYEVFNTICDSTVMRQKEVDQLSKEVDAVVVVGGRSSGNTQRLAEIAQRNGCKTYHIESESELELEALESIESVGITAGASTPAWLIKKVHRRLESVMGAPSRGIVGLLLAAQRSLLLTNIYVSFGAGCLGFASAKLQDTAYGFSHALIAILYVQSMHILNHLTGNSADRFNDPERAEFYRRHRILLALLAIIAGGAGLVTAYAEGMYPFLFLSAMSAMGLSYNLRLIPERIPFSGPKRIRDIPGSKTVLIAIAWGFVVALLPVLSLFDGSRTGTFIVFAWATGMVFVRTAFFDILDMQGDRIVGKETIPILLGEKKSLLLLKSILVAALLLLIAGGLSKQVSSLGYSLAVCPVYLALVLALYEKGHRFFLIRIEFLAETQFLLAGIIALVWSSGIVSIR